MYGFEFKCHIFTQAASQEILWPFITDIKHFDGNEMLSLMFP